MGRYVLPIIRFDRIMESFDETLDFFSSTGVPLRSTVAIKLSESRYQFHTLRDEDENGNSPQVSPTGNDEDGNGDPKPVDSANKDSNKKAHGRDGR